MTKKTMRTVLAGAAILGLGMGRVALADGGGTNTGGKDSKAKKGDAKAAKHSCAGKNDCKGQGGCGDTKGKNDCKGKGGCNSKDGCKDHAK